MYMITGFLLLKSNNVIFLDGEMQDDLRYIYIRGGEGEEEGSLAGARGGRLELGGRQQALGSTPQKRSRQ